MPIKHTKVLVLHSEVPSLEYLSQPARAHRLLHRPVDIDPQPRLRRLSGAVSKAEDCAISRALDEHHHALDLTLFPAGPLVNAARQGLPPVGPSADGEIPCTVFSGPLA